MGIVYDLLGSLVSLFFDNDFPFSFAIWFGCYIGKYKGK